MADGKRPRRAPVPRRRNVTNQATLKSLATPANVPAGAPRRRCNNLLKRRYPWLPKSRVCVIECM